MSTSFTTTNDSSYNQGKRRRRPYTIPVEIQTPPSSNSPCSHNTSRQQSSLTIWQQQQQQQQQPRKRRVEILPGSLLQTTTGGGDPWLHPAEPSQPPPRPTEMVPFLLVGPRHSGKRAAFQTFSNGHKNQVADHASVVEYCKKDVTMWVSDDTNVAACARVQLWNVTTDMSIPQQQQEGRRQQEWMKLISKMTYILLVVSFEEGGPQATLHQIAKWKRWLDESSTVVSLPTVHLILTKSDLLPTCVSPTFWINFGSQLERLCQRLGIRHFHMTTTTLSSSCHTHDHYETPEEVILKLVRSTVASRNTTRKGNFVSTTTTKSKLKGNGSRV